MREAYFFCFCFFCWDRPSRLGEKKEHERAVDFAVECSSFLFLFLSSSHLDLDHPRVGGVLAGLFIVVKDLRRSCELGAIAATQWRNGVSIWRLFSRVEESLAVLIVFAFFFFFFLFFFFVF